MEYVKKGGKTGEEEKGNSRSAVTIHWDNDWGKRSYYFRSELRCQPCTESTEAIKVDTWRELDIVSKAD